MVLELQHDLFLSSQSNNTLKNNIDIIKSKNEYEKNEILMKIKYDAQAQKEKENARKLKNGDRNGDNRGNNKGNQKHKNQKHFSSNDNSSDNNDDDDSYDDDNDNNYDRKNKYNQKNKNNSPGKNKNKNINKHDDIDIQKVYENLFIEMEEKSKVEFENILALKEEEYNYNLELIDTDTRTLLQNKDSEYRKNIQILNNECEVANEDRSKLFEISELLHIKYSKLLEENSLIAKDILQSGKLI